MARHRVAMIVLGGTFVLDLAVAVQAFGRRPSVFAKIRDEAEAPYDIGVCGEPVTPTSLGFTIADLKPIEWISGADTVIVPGLEAPWKPQNPAVLEAIADAATDGARTGLAVRRCVRARSGRRARRAPSHDALGARRRVPGRLPEGDLVEHAMYVDDGQILSSGGMLASADLCLYVLGQDHGQSYANDVSRVLISPPHRTGRSGAVREAAPRDRARLPSRRCSSGWTSTSPSHSPCKTSRDHAHMSRRTLARRFRADTGESFAGWIARRRVERRARCSRSPSSP